MGVSEQQSYRSSLAEQPTRTSLDLELDLQACRTRQRQLMEELSALRELKLRLEEPEAREDPELPLWALRDERFRCLLREAHRQVSLEALAPPHRATVTWFLTVLCSARRPARASRSSSRRRRPSAG